MAVIEANGAQLYCEIRGKGPNLLLIAGGGLDAGSFESFAGVLAADFMVVTYDRRGLSRSPRPEGWRSTSIEEQAETQPGSCGRSDWRPPQWSPTAWAR